MLSDEQLTLIVGDFYETVIRQENSLRLATTDAPGPVAIIPFLDRRLQPQLDQPEHVPVHDAASY
jgi:hypothetical protein